MTDTILVDQHDDVLVLTLVVQATEALTLGLVDEVVTPDRLLAATLDQAREFAQAPTVAAEALKSTLARGPGSLQDALDRAGARNPFRSDRNHDRSGEDIAGV